MLQDLLNQVPSGLFGDKDQAGKAEELQANAQAAQLENTHITPRDPEAFTVQLQEVTRQMYPILEWHDELMQSITETIEKIPVLPTLIEQLQGENQHPRNKSYSSTNNLQISSTSLFSVYLHHLFCQL